LFSLLIIFTALVALAGTFLARPLVFLLFGPDYAPSLLPLQIMAWSLLPYTYAAQASLELVSSGREAPVILAATLALVATALLFLVLVPPFGLAGAGWAVLLGECVQALAIAALRRVRKSDSLPQPAAGGWQSAIGPDPGGS
jgi:O-antigen/teichoic acid export membrane protein